MGEERKIANIAFLADVGMEQIPTIEKKCGFAYHPYSSSM
jgi:hypothetical protein